VGRLPYVPGTKKIEAYFTGPNDAFNLTFSWDPNSGYFTTSWPFVQPDRYDFILGDGDETRFAFGTFRHTADCVASRQSALSIRACDVCTNPNTWIYRRGSYGQCVPTADLQYFNSTEVIRGCPPAYLGSFDAQPSIFMKSANITALTVRLSARLVSVNPLGQLAGTGTYEFSSRWYTFNGDRNGTFSVMVADRSFVPFDVVINFDPWTASISRDVILRVSFPGQAPRLLAFIIPFAPRLSLEGPEFNTKKPLIISPYGDFRFRPYLVASFVNPELVVSIRTFVTAYEQSQIFGREVTVTNLRVNAAQSVRPLVSNYWPAYLLPSSFNFDPFRPFVYLPGVHDFTVVVNEGLPSEERVTDSFAVLDVDDVRNALAGLVGTGTNPDRCNDPVTVFKACYQAGSNFRDSVIFPGLQYPEGNWVKIGAIAQIYLPIRLPGADSDSAEAKFVVRYGHQLWFRGEQTYSGFGEGQMVLPVNPPGLPSGTKLAIGIQQSIVTEQEIVGVARFRTPSSRSIKISSASLIVASIQAPVFRRKIEGVFDISLDVFFQVAIGPSQEFCNQRARYQQRCDVDILYDRPGWTVSQGYLMEIRARVTGSAGIQYLFSISVWTELFVRTSSEKIRNEKTNAIEYNSAAIVGFRLCASATIIIVRYQYCPIDYEYRIGRMPSNSLTWKRSVSDPLSWSMLETTGLTHDFQQLSAPFSWSSKQKRIVPVTDSGSLVLNTIPSANPVSSAGVGRSRGLAMLAWTSADAIRPLPQGITAIFSIYNATSEKLSDPIPIRNTNDADSPNGIVSLPDGRFVVLYTSIPDQGTVADPESLLAKSELQSAVFDPFTSTWGSPASITSDGQYYDGMASAIVFEDSVGQSRVLAIWIRSFDFVVTASNQKQFMWSVFNPTSNSWTSPQILVSNIYARAPPSMSVIRDVILIGYIDDNLAANQTVAYLQRFNTTTQQWAASAVPIGRSYDFVAGTNFNSSDWDVQDPLQFTQHSIAVSRGLGTSFVVVWTDLNAIMSRTYSLTALAALFPTPSSAHPEFNSFKLEKEPYLFNSMF
jgi:hypothetical protein